MLALIVSVSIQTAADAALAAALRAQFSKEIAATNTRVSALEVAAAQKAQGVGNYSGCWCSASISKVSAG
jgi:hypothetical protein